MTTTLPKDGDGEAIQAPRPSGAAVLWLAAGQSLILEWLRGEPAG